MPCNFCSAKFHQEDPNYPPLVSMTIYKKLKNTSQPIGLLFCNEACKQGYIQYNGPKPKPKVVIS